MHGPYRSCYPYDLPIHDAVYAKTNNATENCSLKHLRHVACRKNNTYSHAVMETTLNTYLRMAVSYYAHIVHWSTLKSKIVPTVKPLRFDGNNLLYHVIAMTIGNLLSPTRVIIRFRYDFNVDLFNLSNEYLQTNGSRCTYDEIHQSSQAIRLIQLDMLKNWPVSGSTELEVLHVRAEPGLP